MRFLLIAFAVLAGCGESDNPEEVPAQDAGAPPGPAIPPEHMDRIVALFNRGVALMERYQPTEAAKAFDEAVTLAPGWSTGRLNLGIALLNAAGPEQRARAAVELRRVIAREPRNPTAHYALGMLLRHEGRFDDARAEFEAVLDIDPEDGDSHYQIATLVESSDPEAARRHLETCLERIPHHASACYRLQALLRQAGAEERAREVFARYQALQAAKAGALSGMKYGEMGRYAQVVRAFDAPSASAETVENAPAFQDVAAAMGLTLAARAVPGWPGDGRAVGAAAFGPGVAVADADGDGDLDVFVTGEWDGGAGTLHANERGAFRPAADTGIDGQDAIGACFGDYDADGDPDLYLTRDGPNRLYRNDGGLRFTDVTASTGAAGRGGLSAGAAWADADHDGDLDLFVAGFAPLPAAAGAPPGLPDALFRNNGDGTFNDVAPAAGIDGGPAATFGALFLDADDDRDLDLYVVHHQAPNRLWLNDRAGRYTDAGARCGDLADADGGLGAAAGDVDGDGRVDVLLLRGPRPPRLVLQTAPGRFVEDRAFAALVAPLIGATGGCFGDFDLDGDLDVALLGSGTGGADGHRLLLNGGAGAFAAPVRFGAAGAKATARGAVAADFDDDGMLDLLVARAGGTPELWRAPRPAGRHWLVVAPQRAAAAGGAAWPEPSATGLAVEVKSGRRLQVAHLASSSGYLGGTPARAHFGLGTGDKADYVRLAWPDAALQSEMEVRADQVWRVGKVTRKPSSCPLLFSWDGSRFAFVTDFLGTGGLGFFQAPGEYAPPDPTEDVLIPAGMAAPKDGRWLLRVAEPLEEVTYLDELHLSVHDHPAAIEVIPDERFAAAPPFPTGRPLAVARRIPPRAARNDRGQDVLDRVLATERRCVEPPLDPRFTGYAREHALELDFGPVARGAGAPPLVLFLHGWVEYTYSHVNYAAWQAGLELAAPALEVPDGAGGWRTAIADAGFPAGLPRTMAIDVSALPFGEDGRLRLRTNMAVFWDQAFLGEIREEPLPPARVLRPAVAELRSLGYPREYSPDGAEPTLYDYHRLDRGLPFRAFTGTFTAPGDVRGLLESADDRLAILGRGDEVALEFDAHGLPPLPEGWTRTLVLHAEGWCKDMDLYTAFPDTVEPLPYRAMGNYPPPPRPEGGR